LAVKIKNHAGYDKGKKTIDQKGNQDGITNYLFPIIGDSIVISKVVGNQTEIEQWQNNQIERIEIS